MDETAELVPENQPNDHAPESAPQVHKSRMRRTLERQSKRNLALMGLGVIFIIGALIMFGQSLLINLSLLAGKTKDQAAQQSNSDNVQYIAPPVLDPVSSATNSASAIFSGQVVDAEQVKLFINNELIDVTKVEKDKTFRFNDVPLKEGENKVKAIAWIKDKGSDDSNTIIVTYLKNAPEITIDQPNDGDSFHGPNILTIKGKVDTDASVTINGALVITKDNGSFTYDFPLQNGENKIHIEAIDKAGNKGTKDITVSYSQ